MYAILFFLLAGCGEPDDAYDACVELLGVKCDCDAELMRTQSGSPHACEDSYIEESCGDWSGDVCDPDSSDWDAEGCEDWHDAEAAREEQMEDYLCVADQYREDCDVDLEVVFEVCDLS